MNLEQEDFACIAQIARHCDNDKLCIAVDEAWLFDLSPLLCDFVMDVEDNWDTATEPWNTLINGGEYEGCSGHTKRHKGLKTVLVYYAYARYVMLNGFNDSPNGMVQKKTNQFSLPKPMKEVEMFSDKYRSMGYYLWQQVEAYLCLNQDEFTGYDACNCKPCGCNGCCNSKTQARGYGFNGSNVSKVTRVLVNNRRRIIEEEDIELSGIFDETFDNTFQ